MVAGWGGLGLIPGLDRIPIPALHKVGDHLKFIRTTVEKLVSDRLEGKSSTKVPSGARDLLDMLCDAKDENGERAMTQLQLINESLTFALAGHETTANALVWSIFLLCKHPDVLEKVLVII